MKRHTVELTQAGWVILAAVMMLAVIGVASIYVTNTHYASFDDGPRNAAKQLVRVAVSLFVGLCILRIGYYRIAQHAYLIFFAALVLLVPLLIAKMTGSTFGGLTAPRNGAWRWIHLPGFPLQPSELMKVAFVLALAWYLRNRSNYRKFGGLMVPLAISTVPLVLILKEPDLGTVVLLVAVLFTMLFMAGARIKHLLIICLVGLAVAPLAWKQIKPYQRQRVSAVLLQSDSLRKAIVAEPERYAYLANKRQAIEWAAGSGYQLVHSKNAIGSGGMIGYGWGDGMYVTSALLPDRHNDFIFALVGHQWGLIGCLVVLSCYAVITMSGVLIATMTSEPVARLIAVGVTALIVTQVLVNVGMSIGMMPITGMTLPFVSYGGSSLLTNFIAISLLISVSQRRPFLLALKPFEFGIRRRKTLHLAEPGGESPEAAAPTKSKIRTGA